MAMEENPNKREQFYLAQVRKLNPRSPELALVPFPPK